MGFRVQPNLWQCGPYALKHALIMLGILVDERKITRIARSNGSGTDERSLARAARRFGCDLKEIRLEEPDDARKELTGFLRDGIPCLLCVHQWKHWVAVVKEEKGKFLLLDSEDAAVLTIVGWKELSTMWGFSYAQRRRAAQNRSPLRPVSAHAAFPGPGAGQFFPLTRPLFAAA